MLGFCPTAPAAVCVAQACVGTATQSPLPVSYHSAVLVIVQVAAEAKAGVLVKAEAPKFIEKLTIFVVTDKTSALQSSTMFTVN